MNRIKAVRHQLLVEMALAADFLRSINKLDESTLIEKLSEELILDKYTLPVPDSKRAIIVKIQSNDQFECVVNDDFELYVRSDSSDSKQDVKSRNQQRIIAIIKNILKSTPKSTGIISILDDYWNNGARNATRNRYSDFQYALATIGICLASFCLSMWQATRQFNAFDYSYLLENSHRIIQGEIPYRDFYLCLPPVHYYLQSLLLIICNKYLLAHIILNCLLQCLNIGLTASVIAIFIKSNVLRILCLVPATFVGIATISLPTYDTDACLMFMGFLTLLLYAEKYRYNSILAALAGSLMALLVFTKWNMGLPVVFGLLIQSALCYLLYPRIPFRFILTVLSMFLLTSLTIVYTLYRYDAMDQCIYQTLTAPSGNRLKFFENLFKSLSISISGEQMYSATFCRLNLLFSVITSAVCWFSGTHRHPYSSLAFIPILGIVLGSMQSQLDGSFYGIYPAISILMAHNIRFIQPLISKRIIVFTTCVITSLFVLSMIYDIRANTRNAFLHKPTDDTQPFSLELFQGLHSTRLFRNSFESMISYSNANIRPDEAVYVVPGDGPFYYTTNRNCPVTNYQMFTDTGFNTEATYKQLSDKQVGWVIIKLQGFSFIHYPSNEIVKLCSLLDKTYTCVHQDENFVVLKRNSN